MHSDFMYKEKVINHNIITNYYNLNIPLVLFSLLKYSHRKLRQVLQHDVVLQESHYISQNMSHVTQF